MNSQDYWKLRQIEREKKWHELTTQELKTLKKYYISAGKEIEKEIALLYAKFARENRLPPEEARRLIRGEEFKTWRMTLQEYVAKSKADPKLLRELNTLAMRSRISRIEAIHGRTLMELARLSERLQETADAHFYLAYVENYYQNVYDYHKTIGLPQPPASLDAKRVESVLQTAWNGKNYSARIWANRTKLTKEIQRSMLTAIHRGSSIQQLSKALSQRMDVGYSNAERLIRTELNAVLNKSSADAMTDAEFTHYQFMATLDRRTCARCGERDGEIFAIADMNQGENAPPLHPRCRCTIVATFDTPKSRSKPVGERSARETGDKRDRAPADMTYRDWKAIYIDKSKTFADWRSAKDAKYAAEEAKAAASAKPKIGARNYDNELAKAIGKDYYDKMRDVVENTKHTKAAQVWGKFEGEVRVGSVTEKRAYHMSGKIYFDIAETAAGDTISTPYQTIFHEGGHLIDWWNLKFNDTTWRHEYFSLRYKNTAFLKALDKDFKRMIDAKKAELQAEQLGNMDEIKTLVGERRWFELWMKKIISKSEWRDLTLTRTAAAKKQKIIDRILNAKVSKDEALGALVEEIRATNSLLSRADLSDVFDGYSSGKHNFGAVHGKDYWSKNKEHSRATEAFAEFLSAAIANPESYAVLKKYLPEAEKIFNEMLDELLKVAI